jgi:L-arabinose isomerase
LAGCYQLVQAAKVPVVALNLQPTPALDYDTMTTEEWLANCSACCVPEIGGALTRAHIAYNVVSGALIEDERAWGEIEAWRRAAGATHAVRHARLGFLGHTYPGMLDMYSDFTAISGQLGSHIEVLEIDDLVARIHAATDQQIQDKLAEFQATFDMADAGIDPIAAPITKADLEWSARVAVGLDTLARAFDLSALAYYYRGLEGNENEQVTAGMIVGNSLLTAQGIPCSGEGDLKNAIAMLIMDRLGIGGSYTELYAMDLREQFVLMGHDGPMHLAIADQRPVLRKLKLYHGKRGFGISVECKGESIPGPTFRIGNTNSRIRFSLDPATFVTRWSEEGPTHHCALGVGDQTEVLLKVGRLLHVPSVRVS